MSEVKPGQIWKENDPRFDYYKLVVDVTDKHALLIRCQESGKAIEGLKMVPRWSKLERFNGRRGGYSLHKEAQ